ncbi:MAG: TPM domain-containing protein [Bacteroidales bacterium]|nr:TPM domain-containing protein [Bacteroidales bacterium]
MHNARNFFSAAEKQAIRQRIEQAELNTSGEIRVHIDTFCKEDVLDRAAYLFDKLQMNQTAKRNGVLIYIAVRDKKFAIIGDAGIHSMVDDNFWQDVLQQMELHFKRGEFSAGIQVAIKRAGEKLKRFFPYQSDDINELSDEISYGND